MLRKIRLGICIATVELLFLAANGSLAQDRSPSDRGCSLIERDHPAQFILYEGKSGPSSEVRLRLRNNTSCPIIVQTDDVLPTQLKKLPNGVLRFESVTDSQDGVRLRLHYLIQDRQRGEALKSGYGWGDSVFTYQISSGQSVIFAVPVSHFKRRFDIAVPFNYSWEGSAAIGMGAGGVVHRVYFLFDDLPPDALHAPPREK
jgi:hypothetical protein